MRRPAFAIVAVVVIALTAGTLATLVGSGRPDDTAVVAAQPTRSITVVLGSTAPSPPQTAPPTPTLAPDPTPTAWPTVEPTPAATGDPSPERPTASTTTVAALQASLELSLIHI
jgi:hypothetical protein